MTWLKFFYEGGGSPSDFFVGLSGILVVMIYAAQWIRRWVEYLLLPPSNLDRKRHTVPLAPLYLSSLYARFDKCTGNITWAMGCYDVVTHADSSFLQVFIWDRLPLFASKPT